MFGILLYVAIVFAFLDWLSLWKGLKKLEYIAKPGAMLALLAWMIFQVNLTLALAPFALGIFFSIIGDVLLMLPNERFVGGLAAFLLAHVCYIVGFSTQIPQSMIFAVIMLVVIGAVAWSIYRRLAQGIAAKGLQKLILPVRLYAAVISVMLFSAWMTVTYPHWSSATAVIVIIGATLFFASDSLLAWNRFITPLRNGRLAVMITYQLGQILIALGAAVQFMK